MEEKKGIIPQERRVPLIVLAVGVLLIAVFLWLATRPGISYKGEFLARQAENCWQGQVLGEETTVTWTDTGDGAVVRIVCESGEREYELAGDREKLVLYEDGEARFRGSYHDGLLRGENGELIVGGTLSVTTTNGTYYIDDDGNQVRDSALYLTDGEAIALLLLNKTCTRGEPAMAIGAGIMLLLLFLDLWFPEWAYWLNIGRWTRDDPEPSDWYYTNRTIGHILEGGLFVVFLAMGM